MKVRVIKNQDGSVGIAYHSPKSKLTEAEFFAKANPAGLPFEDVDSSTIPSDREYRDCWELDGQEVKVNQTKKAAQEAKKADKALAKGKVLSKLDITEEEYAELFGG